MEIDAYIAALVKLRQTHGPALQVLRAFGQTNTFVKAPLPRIAHTHKKHTRSFFTDKEDLDQHKGEKAVRV